MIAFFFLVTTCRTCVNGSYRRSAGTHLQTSTVQPEHTPWHFVADRRVKGTALALMEHKLELEHEDGEAPPPYIFHPPSDPSRRLNKGKLIMEHTRHTRHQMICSGNVVVTAVLFISILSSRWFTVIPELCWPSTHTRWHLHNIQCGCAASPNPIKAMKSKQGSYIWIC